MSTHVSYRSQVIAAFQSIAQLLQQAPEEEIRAEALRCEQLLLKESEHAHRSPRTRKKSAAVKKQSGGLK